MYRRQAQQLATARVGTLADDPVALRGQVNSVLDTWQNVLTACGPLEHDTDGGQINLYGEAPVNAGMSDDWAVLRISQSNQFEGEASNPNLYAQILDGGLKVNGRLVVPAAEPIYGIARIATATGNWVNNAHPAVPTVAATDNDTGDVLSILLYRTSPAMDPNVRTGYTVVYALDLAGNAVATCGYVDDKVGMVKVWSGAVIDIPGGWQICDGTNGTVDLRDRFLVGAGTTYAVGATGGATTHGHSLSGTSGTGTASISMSGSTASGTASISMSGTTSTNSAYSITLSGHTDDTSLSITMSGSTASTTATNQSATTGLVLNQSSTNCGGGASAVVTYPASLTDGGHNHTQDSHTHSAGSLAASVSAHNHNLSGGTSTAAASAGTHTHTAGTLAATDSGHTHAAGTLAATDAGHSHGIGSYAAAASSNLPPYYALAFIQRIN